MTCNASALRPAAGADGSFSLHSGAFGEGFHSPAGARWEADHTYLGPAELQRYAAGAELRVLDVGVGLGYNSAVLLEAAAERGLTLRWWGLEQDLRPLQLALADPGFCAQWRPSTLQQLGQVLRGEAGWSGRILWGDARQQLAGLEPWLRGRCDLVLLDPFSPRHCPQLWSQDFLGRLARLLAPGGRLLTYCSAAAVRGSLRDAGLELAALQAPAGTPGLRPRWSGGTAASPRPLAPSTLLRPLSAMEEEHLLTRAGEPYRDPSARAGATEIQASRLQMQAQAGRSSTGAWRRRWVLDHPRRNGVVGPT
ncbi:MnmC family methyltransferase [Cyanobium sp. NS01]|uniref:MnmC family methyltransferase n=1 Tax=Cyanobium sp. NS01 TaxID=261284 RepID=UPI00164925BC|nr:MnmC family methyltransferase [Cyanobium sp. NS01]QNI70660.1 S-adenosyl-L-methionine-dependent methyltransferase family protein [Cyanobium sp. NS01]